MGRQAKRKHRENGKLGTLCRVETGGRTSSTSSAVLSAIRLTPQLGRKPRRLPLDATRCLAWQDSQRTGGSPCSRRPLRPFLAMSRARYKGAVVTRALRPENGWVSSARASVPPRSGHRGHSMLDGCRLQSGRSLSSVKCKIWTSLPCMENGRPGPDLSLWVLESGSGV